MLRKSLFFVEIAECRGIGTFSDPSFPAGTTLEAAIVYRVASDFVNSLEGIGNPSTQCSALNVEIRFACRLDLNDPQTAVWGIAKSAL